MPKLTGPMFSVEASKSLAKTLTFQRRPGGASVYGYKKPKVPLTAKQILQRWLIGNAVSSWQALSAGSKDDWELKAKGLRQSGYSLFMHENTIIGYNMYLAPDFSVGQGSILPDLSRFVSHGAITGASWAEGLYGKCLDFDPLIPSYVEIPAAFTQLDFTSEDFSIIARIKWDDLSATRAIIGRGRYNVTGWACTVYSPGRVVLFTNQSGGVQYSETVNGSIVIDTWYTVGISRSGTSVRMFLQGVDATSTAGTHTDPLTNNRKTLVGVAYDEAGEPMDGKIEFLRIFGGIALSPADQLAWHNALK